jgi:capsule polysaccharide export protein KpsE/RkpR
MSYQQARESLAQYRRLSQRVDPGDEELLQAFEHLTNALEADLTQIKGALAHLARLLEDRR